MRLATTICGLALSLSLAAQKPAKKIVIPVKPVTEDYRDFSDWKTIDTVVLARFHEMNKYPLPRQEEFTNEVINAIYYLDAVEVPDWEALFPRRDNPYPSVDVLRFSADSTTHLPNRFTDGAAHLYFPNESYALASSDTADIKALLTHHMELQRKGFRNGLSPYDTTLRFTVEGRADKSPFAGRTGEMSDCQNYALSECRAVAVAGVIKDVYPEAVVEIRAFGNAEPLCEGDDARSLALNRVVRVIPGKTAIECGLEQTEGDYTIGDGSYSMVKDNGAGYPPLEIVMLYPYENGNIFLFSNRGALSPYQRDKYNHHNRDDSPVLLTKYAPAFEARTPLKEVMLYLALVADPGTSFRFITDGVPSPSKVQYDHILSVAQKRDITFSFVGTGAYNPQFNQLRDIAAATGGRTYFACDPKGAFGSTLATRQPARSTDGSQSRTVIAQHDK